MVDKPKTMFHKLWDSHLIDLRQDGEALLQTERDEYCR